MKTLRALLVVVAVTFAVALDAKLTAFAQTSMSVGPQSTYKLAAGRDKDAADGARGSRDAPAVVKPDDDDDKPRIRRVPMTSRHASGPDTSRHAATESVR